MFPTTRHPFRSRPGFGPRPARRLSFAVALTLAVPAAAELTYGVTDTGFLVSFDSATPGTIESGSALSGLQLNEQILGIDVRPATGELYGVGSFSNLYRIDTASGAASLVGAGGFSPALNGSSFGFDFNPVIDRIRLVSDADKNTVLNPNDGTATGVTDLFYAAGDDNAGSDPNVVHSAYTNSFLGTTSTQLYGIDTGLDLLVTQANSAGTLQTVGAIGTDVTDVGGFDISGVTGDAFLAVVDNGASQTMFWSIDLTTGVGSFIGPVGGGSTLTAIAVVPEPASALLLAAGTLVTLRRRRA